MITPPLLPKSCLTSHIARVRAIYGRVPRLTSGQPLPYSNPHDSPCNRSPDRSRLPLIGGSRIHALFVAIYVLAVSFRVIPTLIGAVDLPVNFLSGGLFTAFALEIVDNGYFLPAVIPFYTEDGIPFVYPPLAFYIQAMAMDWFGVPAFVAANILPPAFAVLTIPSMHVLLRVLRLRQSVQLTALFAFATSSMLITQHTDGAGLAASLGALLSIWLAVSVFRIRDTGQIDWYIATGILWGLCLMASPGTAYGSTLACGLFFAWSVVRAESPVNEALRVGMTILLAVVASSLYWVQVIQNGNLPVLVASFLNEQDPATHFDRYRQMFAFRAVWNHSFIVLNVAVALGIVHQLRNREWWLLAWLLAWWVIPHEGIWMTPIPASIIAGAGVVWVLDAMMVVQSDGRRRRPRPNGFVVGVLLCAFVVLALASGVKSAYHRFDRDPLSAGYVQALETARETLPADARLIVPNAYEDWSPLLAERDVLNMRWGAEWEPGTKRVVGRFNGRMRGCENDVDCVEQAAFEAFGERDDVYYIVKRGPGEYGIVKLGEK